MVKKKKGFTLVELLVVMAMSATMIAVTIVSLSDARSKKAVEGEGRKFAAVVREMQNYALTGKQFESGRVTCGAGIFSIGNEDGSYRTSYAYRTGTSCANASVFENLSPVPLLNGVQFSSDVGAFYFRVPRGDAVDSSLATIATPRLIVLQKSTAYYSICVYPSGAVTEAASQLGSCPAL